MVTFDYVKRCGNNRRPWTVAQAPNELRRKYNGIRPAKQIRKQEHLGTGPKRPRPRRSIDHLVFFLGNRVQREETLLVAPANQQQERSALRILAGIVRFLGRAEGF